MWNLGQVTLGNTGNRGEERSQERMNTFSAKRVNSGESYPGGDVRLTECSQWVSVTMLIGLLTMDISEWFFIRTLT